MSQNGGETFCDSLGELPTVVWAVWLKMVEEEHGGEIWGPVGKGLEYLGATELRQRGAIGDF